MFTPCSLPAAAASILVQLLPKTECLNEEIFDSLADARRTQALWRYDYNNVRVGATAFFVLAMGWLVARARPAVAAVAIAMPVVIGPGFFVLALERDADFVMRAAEDGLGALTGTVAFAVAVALLAGRRVILPVVMGMRT